MLNIHLIKRKELHLVFLAQFTGQSFDVGREITLSSRHISVQNSNIHLRFIQKMAHDSLSLFNLRNSAPAANSVTKM